MSLWQIIHQQCRICTIILASDSLDSCCCRVCVPEWVFIFAMDRMRFWKGTCFLLTRSTDLLMVSTLGNFGPGGGRVKRVFGAALTFIRRMAPLSTICQAKDTCSAHGSRVFQVQHHLPSKRDSAVRWDNVSHEWWITWLVVGSSSLILHASGTLSLLSSVHSWWEFVGSALCVCLSLPMATLLSEQHLLTDEYSFIDICHHLESAFD